MNALPHLLLLVVVGVFSICKANATPPTMRAYVATATTAGRTSTSIYTPNFPMPTLGELHKIYSDLPTPSCEVLIRVSASSINPSDVTPSISNTLLPHVMGSDVAGTVLRVQAFPTSSTTSSTTTTCRVQPGDRVYGDIGANTHTLQGEKTKELGAYAEYVVALDTQLALVPTAMDFLEAAALPKVALTSIKAIALYGGGRNASFQGSTVLVLGGSGGTGTTGIQLVKYFGATNITTTTSSANTAYCLALGATRVIDYHAEDWWDPTVNPDNTYDFVYDTVGQDGTGNRAMRVLKPGGYYVTITGQLATVPKPGVTQSMFINSDTNLNSWALMDELAHISGLHQLRMPRLSSPYALNNMSKAFAESEKGHVVGKLIVSMEVV
jgi:NADPH:quinone reductase-like Zn-dependent oxidoreductase